MFCVIYSFKVKVDSIKKFKESWRGLTPLIYEYEGSLGSRLHQQHENTFIAYAQWPDEITFNNSGSKLPKEAYQFREVMRNSCTSIDTIFKMNMIDDLLKDKNHGK